MEGIQASPVGETHHADIAGLMTPMHTCLGLLEHPERSRGWQNVVIGAEDLEPVHPVG